MMETRWKITVEKIIFTFLVATVRTIVGPYGLNFFDVVLIRLDCMMKFRGKMVEISSIQHFAKVLSTVGRLAKITGLRITPTHMYFILNERVASGGSGLWCELPQNHYFNEYNMEGVSEEYNEIYLELNPENLVTAFKSTQAAKSVKIKLTKKHVPCLTVEIELPSLASNSRFVVHDVPVSVVPRRLWDEFQEPAVPQFDISLYMPSLKVVKNVIERMKNISTHVVVSANQEGELTLKVETGTVSVATHFKDLESPSAATRNQMTSQQDPLPWAETRIDIRKLSQFLFGQQINPIRVICNIIHSKMIHLFLLHDDVSLQFFLPSIAS